jgi:hypothetical protein
MFEVYKIFVDMVLYSIFQTFKIPVVDVLVMKNY